MWGSKPGALTQKKPGLSPPRNIACACGGGPVLSEFWTLPQDGASLPHVSSLLIVYTRLPISLLNLAFPAISPNSMNGNSVFPPACAPNKNSSLSFPPASNPSANPAASSFKTNPESDHFLAPPSTSSRSHKTSFTLHCLLWSFGSCPCSLQSILGAAARGILSNQKSDHVLFC